jgi:hypothetical protein
MKYEIWYARNPSFTAGVDPAKIKETHALVKTLETDSLDEVFCLMQAENWSPNGEARPLIRSLGLLHTSMSVGDVAVEHDNQRVWICAPFGWTSKGDCSLEAVTSGGWRLVHKKDGMPVSIGEVINNVTVTGGRHPLHENSSGRVWVTVDGRDAEYFPHVYDLEWIR